MYLDANATTPIDPRVLAAFTKAYQDFPANPASSHQMGSKARSALEDARGRMLELCDCRDHRLVFTSGGTEANNLALYSFVAPYIDSQGRGRGTILFSAIEHPAVKDMCQWLHRRFGFDLKIVPCDRDGFVSPNALAKAMTDDTRVVAIMQANNEVGTVQPIRALHEVCREHGVPLHVDTTQSFGKTPIWSLLGELEAFTISPHKFNGPKGVGALVISRSYDLHPLVIGGGQESSARSGTHNLPGILAMVEALEICHRERGASFQSQQRRLREQLWQAVSAAYSDATRNSPDDESCLANTLSVAFPPLEAEMLVIALEMRGVTVSTGAACASGTARASAVLEAMGADEARLKSTLRLSFLADFTEDDAARVGEAVRAATQGLLALR